MDATVILWVLTGVLVFFGALFWVVKTAVREGLRDGLLEVERDRLARTADSRETSTG